MDSTVHYTNPREKQLQLWVWVALLILFHMVLPRITMYGWACCALYKGTWPRWAGEMKFQSGMSFVPTRLSPNQRYIWVCAFLGTIHWHWRKVVSKTGKQWPSLCSSLCCMQNLEFYLCSKHFQTPFIFSQFVRPVIKPILRFIDTHQYWPKPALARMLDALFLKSQSKLKGLRCYA